MSAAQAAPPLRGPRSSVLATAALVRDPYAFHGCRGAPFAIDAPKQVLAANLDIEDARAVHTLDDLVRDLDRRIAR